MKLKILVKIIEKLFGMTDNGEGPRADVYLPDKLLAMGLVFLAIGIAGGIYFAFSLQLWAIAVAICGIVFGVFALLCWKNQSIKILNENQFVYTTMFGRSKTYNFSDIEGIRRNNDSITLLVKGEKVHIESMALMSESFVSLVNNAMEK